MTPVTPAPRPVRIWLLVCMALVALMVFIGGVTRLTESGLSIVEWKLFSGVFPPTSDAAWEQEFAAYQTSPEFQKKNFHFGVAEFQRIYWLEYIHRVLGRVIGLALALPFFVFLTTRHLRGWLGWRMFGCCILVGLQGVVGWVMVASGLVDDPRVSPVKLALHLSLAFALFGVLLWTYWQACDRARLPSPGNRCLWDWLFGLTCAQIILGALVAGMDAGLSYNTYPLMDGHLVPPGAFDAYQLHSPLQNIPFIQFLHRAGAHLVLGLGLVFWLWHERREALSGQLQRAVRGVAAVLGLQFLLGVWTLIHQVPLGLASAHQMAALLLVATLLNVRYVTARETA
jgi:cytochrome c oxidase assembly protein subunit 15